MNRLPTWEETFASLPHKPAECIYGIAFTARSGSTWLGQVIAASGVLGDPREYFNQNAASYTVTNSACSNVREYYEYLKTVKQSDGVFGFEIAYFHLSRLLQEGYGDLLDDVGTWILLRRKDYIAQAVSHYKANYTGVFHSTQGAGEVSEAPYDPKEIRKYALALLSAEKDFADFFSRAQVSPAELWYEDLIRLSHAEIVATVIQLFGSKLTLANPENQAGQPQKKPVLQKLANRNSDEFIERFRKEHPEFVHYWDENRGKINPRGLSNLKSPLSKLVT